MSASMILFARKLIKTSLSSSDMNIYKIVIVYTLIIPATRSFICPIAIKYSMKPH